jgi:hypothetical protein
MARQFRDQLEDEAHNLETKVNIDPGIDMSLTPKPAPTPAPAPTATTTTAAAVSPPVSPEPQPQEEEFYPPDHHMHPSHAAGEATPAESPPASGAQAELDLTTPPAESGRSPP